MKFIARGCISLLLLLLMVLSVAANPILNQVSSQTVNEGDTLTLTVSNSAPDNGAITYTLTSSPIANFVSSATVTNVNNESVSISLTPGFTDAGSYTLTIKSEDVDSSDTKDFILTVNENSGDIDIPSILLIGDDKQRASNPEADDFDDRIEELTISFIIRNTGGDTITGLTSDVLPASGFSLTDTNIRVSNLPVSLDAGQSKTVSITGIIPGKLDAVDAKKLTEKSFQVATLVITGSSASSGNIEQNIVIEMQRENQLEIDDVDVCINGQCVSVDDGDDVENVRPGDRVDFTFNVENKFSDSDKEDLDIEDVQLEWEIDDDDLDEDDDEDLGDLSADDQETESFSFSIDDDVPAGTYRVTAMVFGRDENNALHGQEMEFDLEIERDRHDITMRRVSVSPSTLSCVGSGIVTFDVAYVNIGRDDEDDVVISVENDELGIKESIGPVNLDEDDSRQDSIRINLGGDNIKPDTYIFKVKSFHATSVQSDEAQVAVTVPDCSNTDDDRMTGATTVVQPVVQPQLPPQPPTVTRVSQDDEISTGYMVALGIGVLVLLLFVIFGAIFVGRRRP